MTESLTGNRNRTNIIIIKMAMQEEFTDALPNLRYFYTLLESKILNSFTARDRIILATLVVLIAPIFGTVSSNFSRKQ